MAKSIFEPEDLEVKEFVLPRSKVKVEMREAFAADLIQLGSQNKVVNAEGNTTKSNLILFSLVCTFNSKKFNADDLRKLTDEDYYFLLDNFTDKATGNGTASLTSSGSQNSPELVLETSKDSE